MRSRFDLIIHFLRAWLSRWRGAAQGQGLVEYAAILVFIAATLVVAELFLQPQIALTLDNVANSFH